MAVYGPKVRSVGSSSYPLQANGSHIFKRDYYEHIGTSGDVRGEYQDLTFSNTGSGETLRIRAIVNNANAGNGGTINGMHVTAKVNDACGVPAGTLNAIKATVESAETGLQGQVSCIQCESNLVTGTTPHADSAFIDIVDVGASSLVNLLNFKDCTSASGALHYGNTLKCVGPSGAKYIVLSDTENVSTAQLVWTNETTGAANGTWETTGAAYVALGATAGTKAHYTMASSTATSGDNMNQFHWMKSMGAGGTVVAGDFIAEQGINNCGNAIGLQGFAYAEGSITVASGSQIACGVYSGMVFPVGCTSAGSRWSMWTDDRSDVKATGSHYMQRISANGTCNLDGVFTIYGGDRLPILFNFENSEACVSTTGGTYSTADGYIKLKYNGTSYRIPIFTGVDG